jgi:hypothetical protein
MDNEGIAFNPKTWIHIAVVTTPDAISLFIGDKRIDFTKQSISNQSKILEINPYMFEFNLDELMIDETTESDFIKFAENTINRVPYAALSHEQKWFVLEVDDPMKVKTNLFETEQFKAAVRAVINE